MIKTIGSGAATAFVITAIVAGVGAACIGTAAQQAAQTAADKKAFTDAVACIVQNLDKVANPALLGEACLATELMDVPAIVAAYHAKAAVATATTLLDGIEYFQALKSDAGE